MSARRCSRCASSWGEAARPTTASAALDPGRLAKDTAHPKSLFGTGLEKIFPIDVSRNWLASVLRSGGNRRCEIDLEREGASLVTVQQLIDMLQARGWRLTKTENDIRHYQHDSIALRVTLSGKLELSVPPRVLSMIQRGTQLEDARDALRRDL